MKIIAKKSLLNKTSKHKKQKKYSEIITKQEYAFGLREQLIYLGGLYPDKNGTECVVNSRSQNRNGRHFYKVEFSDGLCIETISETLIKKGEEEIVD